MGARDFVSEEQGNKGKISSGNKDNTGEMHCLNRGTSQLNLGEQYPLLGPRRLQKVSF